MWSDDGGTNANALNEKQQQQKLQKQEKKKRKTKMWQHVKENVKKENKMQMKSWKKK